MTNQDIQPQAIFLGITQAHIMHKLFWFIRYSFMDMTALLLSIVKLLFNFNNNNNHINNIY